MERWNCVCAKGSISQKSELGKLEGGMNCVCVTKVALGKPLRGLSSGIGNTQ